MADMNEREFQEYLKGRYQEMLDFYDNRAVSNKQWYCRCSVYIIALSAVLAPILMLDLGNWKYVIAFASASIAIASGVLAFFKFQENWLRYRSTWDCLKREPHLRKARLDEYERCTEPNRLFVQRVESLFAQEGAEWLAKHSCKEEVPSSPPVNKEVKERLY